MQKSSNLIRLKTSTQLFNYVPDLLEIDSNVRDLLNADKSISDATAAHIYHFADY
jgi:hypothetical protein